jgi:hypothetical protein
MSHDHWHGGGLERRNRLSIYSSRSLVGLHTFEGFPNLPFGDLERLCLVRGLLPSPRSSARFEQMTSLGPQSAKIANPHMWS